MKSMAHPKNPKRFIVLQIVFIVIAVILTVASIIDLVSGQTGTSIWIGVVCWPIVAVLSAVQIVQVRKQL